MKKHPLLSRFFVIALLAGLLIAPLVLVSDKISERQATRSEVLRELASTGVDKQQLAGPLLVVPCVEHYFEEVTDASGQRRREKLSRDCSEAYVADDVSITGTLTIENRYRGIYSARFYLASLDISGTFDPKLIDRPAADGVSRDWGQPILQLFVADVRGIRNRVTLNWSGDVSEFAPGLGSMGDGTGIHAPVGAAGALPRGKKSFSLKLALAGMEQLAFVPSGGQTSVKLSAPWPDPSFFGHHLPDDRTIADDHFDAAWSVSALASDAPRALVACVRAKCQPPGDRAFGVALIEPVNVYLKSSRATSYGFLFVALTFTVFFLTEVLERLAIHPAQYTLVGLALIIFFLLLFSLAEHIDFALAYAIAATACVTLLAVYTMSALKSTRRGMAFGGMLALLYGALYLLLRSEDYALLLGSCLVFGVLTILMLLTRKLDWYEVAKNIAERRILQDPLPRS